MRASTSWAGATTRIGVIRPSAAVRSEAIAPDAARPFGHDQVDRRPRAWWQPHRPASSTEATVWPASASAVLELGAELLAAGADEDRVVSGGMDVLGSVERNSGVEYTGGAGRGVAGAAGDGLYFARASPSRRRGSCSRMNPFLPRSARPRASVANP